MNYVYNMSRECPRAQPILFHYCYGAYPEVNLGKSLIVCPGEGGIISEMLAHLIELLEAYR